VDEYAGAVLSTISKFKDADKRIEIFGKFLHEEWDLYIARFYLQIWKLFEDSKAGPEYANRPGDDLPKQQIVSKVRCLYILNSIKAEIPNLIDQIIMMMENKCVVVSETEYSKAMNLAGYKLSGPNAFSPMDYWGVDDLTAKQVLRKIDFLDIVCSLYANSGEYLVSESTSLASTARGLSSTFRSDLDSTQRPDSTGSAFDDGNLDVS
jgi:hypothetical protein